MTVDESEYDVAGERRVLAQALWLNVALAAGLWTSGFIADSSGLIANALDNTSDVAVYALAFYATTHGARWKARAARLSGLILLVLAVAVVADVVRRYFSGSEPQTTLMIAMTIVAAGLNLVALRVLHSHRSQAVHLRAAWTFSINDFLSNAGVLVAALLVAWLQRPWPDLAIGLIIAIVVGRGGLEILADVRRTEADGT